MSQCITPAYTPSTVLQDVNANGKPRPWARHKTEAQVVATALDVAGMADDAQRMRTCADWLQYNRAADGLLHLHRANFCRVRMCPICQWRRSLKVAAQVQACDAWVQARRAAQRHKPYKHIMLTLTVPNVAGQQLAGTLDTLSAAWGKISRRAEVRRAVRGYIRATEITYNRSAGTYHPHLHILVACNASYFTSRDYVTRDRWLQLWREATGLQSITQVDVRRAADLSGLVAEIAKYTTKPSDYLLPDDVDTMAAVVGTLARTCHHRRFVSFGGVYRTAYQALLLDDAETGDLVHIAPDNDALGATDAECIAWTYCWYPGPRLYILSAR